MPFTYVLECGDGSYYTGSTWDLARRVEQHQSGDGGDYTRKRQPVKLVFAAELDRIEDAYLLEKRIQGWSREKRRALIEGRLEALPGLSSRARARTTRGFETRRPEGGAPQPAG